MRKYNRGRRWRWSERGGEEKMEMRKERKKRMWGGE